jgi:hypothetical protein
MAICKTAAKALSIVAISATIAVSLPAKTSAQTADFSGKTVEVMVNFAAGGATDAAARLITPFIARHLPGNPDIFVSNRAGAGGTAAVDYMINSVAPNGMTIGYFSGTPLRWALGIDQVPEQTGDLVYVAGKSVNLIVVQRADLPFGFDTMQGYDEPLFMAVNNPTNHISIRMRLLADALDLGRFELITGYETQGRMVAAARADEVNLTETNDTYFGSNRAALEGDDVLSVLGQMGEFVGDGIVAQSGLEDIPVFDTLWHEHASSQIDSPEYRAWVALHQAMAAQNVFILPTNTPPEFVSAWEAAILAAYEDEEYLALTRDIGLPNASSIDTAGITKLMVEMKATFEDPEVRAAIETAIERNMQ